MMNHRIGLAGAFSVLLFSLSATASLACDSGPDFCTDDPRIPAALEEKKARLLNEYPERLVNLLDLGVQCIARIERSPDGFSLVIVDTNATTSLTWSQDNEDASKAQMAAGDVKRFWIVNARHAFSCDGQPPYNEQADYDSVDDLNTSLAIKCGEGGNC